MNFRVLLLGLLLFVVGIVIAAGSVSSTLPSFSSVSAIHVLNVSGGSTSYVLIQLNDTGGFSLSYNSSVPVVFVLANSSAFNRITFNSTAITLAAESLEGKGVFELANGSVGIFPYENLTASNITTRFPVPKYAESESLFSPGAYYAIFSNTGNSTAHILVKSAIITAMTVSSNEITQLSRSSSYIIISSILMLLGILLIVISLFMHGRESPKKTAESEEEINKLYSRVEKAEKASRVGRARHSNTHVKGKNEKR
ncbi:MAG: hypothetical protein QXV13_01025 [Candidatus Micrarchaeaceae archaeon]